MEENDLLKQKIEEARATLPKETRDAIDAVDWKMPILELRETNGYSFTQLDDLEIETELLLCGLISAEQYPIELGQRMGLPKQEIEKLVTVMNQKVFQKIRQELVKISAQKEKMKTTNSVQVEPKPLEQKIEVNPTAQKIEIKKEPEKKKVGTVIEVMPEELPKGEDGIINDQLRITNEKASAEVANDQLRITNEKIEDRDEILDTLENPEKIPVKPVIQIEKTETKIEEKPNINPVVLDPNKKIPTPDFAPSKKLFETFRTQETTTEHTTEKPSVPSNSVQNTSAKPKIDPYREIPE